jgi:hypothetical protein
MQPGKHIFVLSQGQLFDTQSPDLVVRDLIYKTGFHHLWVKAMLCFDYARDSMPFGSGSAINRYKKGQIDTNQFYDEIRWLLGTSLGNGQIQEAWNKMCPLTDRSRATLTKLSSIMLGANDLLIIAVAGTNHEHFRRNQDHFRNVCGDRASSSKIIFVNSFDHGTTDLNELLKTVQLDSETKISEVTSLHKGINPRMLATDISIGVTNLATTPTTDIGRLIDETLTTYRNAPKGGASAQR